MQGSGVEHDATIQEAVPCFNFSRLLPALLLGAVALAAVPAGAQDVHWEQIEWRDIWIGGSITRQYYWLM